MPDRPPIPEPRIAAPAFAAPFDIAMTPLGAVSGGNGRLRGRDRARCPRRRITPAPCFFGTVSQALPSRLAGSTQAQSDTAQFPASDDLHELSVSADAHVIPVIQPVLLANLGAPAWTVEVDHFFVQGVDVDSVLAASVIDHVD